MPRESFDAPENLPNESRCQVVLRRLQDEVSGMPDEAPAGLDQPLLQACRRPTLNGMGQSEATQKVAKVVGDDPEQQSDLVGPESVTGEPGPVGGFLPSLIHCSAVPRSL